MHNNHSAATALYRTYLVVFATCAFLGLAPSCGSSGSDNGSGTTGGTTGSTTTGSSSTAGSAGTTTGGTGEATTTTTGGTTCTTTETWGNGAQAFFANNCTSCHGPTGSQGTTYFDGTSYSSVAADRADIASQINTGAMPEGATLDSNDKANILTWLACNPPPQ